MESRKPEGIRRLVSGLVGAALAVALLPVGAIRTQAPTPITLLKPAVSTAEDFATVAYGDPFDFDNPEDVRLLPDRTHAVNARLEDGELRFGTGASSTRLELVFPGYPGALPMERDGGAIPIDADRYTHVAMRIHSPAQRVMAFSYDRRLAREHSDDFGRETTGNVLLEAGWNTLLVDLAQASAGRQLPWAGQVYGFRLLNAPAEGEYRIDYLRLQTEPETVQVTWDPALGDRLVWDRDDDPTNNSAEHDGWGQLTSATPGRATFPAGAHEPGQYRFLVEGAGAAGYSEPLRVVPRPAPILLEPDLAGGQDYATAVLGKPWDFSTPHDLAARGNFIDDTFGPHGLTAMNAPPAMNDPFFYLRMGPPLDAARYHRLTVHAGYEGPFDLADAPGGGSHARLLWTRTDRDQDRVIQGNKLIESRELVHYPGQGSFTVDLTTPPDPAVLMETDSPARDGWVAGSGLITHLRYDPNEDPGPRRWNVRRIEIRANDEPRAGAFDISWRDAASDSPDVRVTLSYRPDAGGPETVIASDIPQRPGEVNAYRWITADVPPGTYRIVIRASDGVGEGRNVSTGPVDVRPSLRLSGPDRLSTAVALSRAAFPDGADIAVVARAEDFPDALAAAPLAAAARGPLLLNPAERLAGGVVDELRRLGASSVYLMGGERAQSPAVEAGLEQLGITVTRMAGPDRFATAAAAAQRSVALWQEQGHDAGREVVVALGEDFPDALAAGVLAGSTRRPLLLSGRGHVPEPTLEALAALGVRRVTVVGGAGAVSPGATDRLAAGGADVMRIAGSTRHETAELAAQATVDAGADARRVIVASGRAFPDALAAGPAAHALGGVLLLTEPDVLPAVSGGWVAGHRPMSLLRVAGGPAAVSDAVERQLLSMGG